MIRIIEKNIRINNNVRMVPILERAGEEGILQKTLAELVGLQDPQLSVLIVRHQLDRSPLTKEEAAVLRQAGVMSLRAPKGNFIPKNAVGTLAGITGIFRVKNFYSQAWPD